nr:hypothetical protein [Candidatus Thioglobus sp.]
DAGEEFKTPTEANNNALQYGIEQEKARIKALEAEKAKAKPEVVAVEPEVVAVEPEVVAVDPEETKVIDNNELLKIVSDNDNNLDKITTETSGDTGVKTTFENKREKPKKEDDTTPVATKDVNTGKTIVSQKTGKETPSAVMSFLGDVGDMALKGTGAAIYGAGKLGNEVIQELEYSQGPDGTGTEGAGYVPGTPYQGGQTLEEVLPSVESIEPVGGQPVDDSQFVNTMDGQLADQGYMGPSVDNVAGPQEDFEAMALDGAPQYDIQGLPTLHQEGGQFIEQAPEDVIAGAQGLVDQTEGAITQGDFEGLEEQIPEQQLAQLGNEVSLGDIQGMLGGVGDTLTSMADGAGDIGERAYESVEAAVQNIEKVLAETGLINDPQAIEAVNEFVQKVDELVSDEELMKQFEASKQQSTDSNLVDPLVGNELELPEEEKSFWDTITDFLGDLLTQFTEITGITSQDLMRALIMYAGSRLLGYSGHDSVQFAYKDFEKNIERRFEDNKESREFLANDKNLNDALDGLYAQKAEAEATGGDTSSLDRRIKSIEAEAKTLASGKMTTAAKDYALFETKKADLDARRAAEEATVSSLPPEEQEAALEEITNKYDLEEGVLTKALTDAPDYKSKDKAQTHKNALDMNKVREKRVGDYLKGTQEAADMARLAKGDSEYFLKLTGDLYTGLLGDTYAGWNRVMAAFGMNIDENAKGETAKVKIHDFVQKRMAFTKGSITEREMELFKQASPKLSMSKEGLQLLLEGMIYNDQYTIDANRNMNKFVQDYVTSNDGMYPTTQALNLEIDRYKEENPFELPFTNEEMQKAKNAREFDFTKGMTPEDQDDKILEAADAGKALDVDQMKAALRANKRRQK